MKHIFLLPLFTLIVSMNSYGDSIEEMCKSTKEQNIHCNKFVQTSPIDLDELNMAPFVKWSWVSEKLEERKKYLQVEIDNQKGMFRFLRDGFVEEDENRDWYEEEYKKTKEDFKNLQAITSEIDIVSKRVNMCFRVCTSAMRLENEDHLKKLQKLKIILLSKRPVLAGPKVEEMIFKKDIKDDELKNALMKTYSGYLTEAKKRIGEIKEELFNEKTQFEFATKARDGAKKRRSDLFLKMISDKDSIDDTVSRVLSEMDWRSEIMNGDDPALSCHFYNENLKYMRNQKIKDVSLEVGMATLPFVVGPTFRLGVWGLRGAGLLKWGMREEIFASVTKASAGLSSTAYFLKDTTSIPKKKEECSSLLSRFIETNKKVYYQKYIECERDVSSDILFLAAETSLVGLSSMKSIMNSLELSKGFRKDSTLFHVKDFDELTYYLESKKIDNANFGEAGFKLSSKKGDYYVLNLNGPKKEVEAISSKYWEFVSDTYKARLNLSPEEIKSFIKSSKAMEPRTTLLVSTMRNQRDNLRGGVALVDSSKKSELLPFEKATGIRIKRQEGRKIGEVVRLTVDGTKGDRKLSDELISQLVSSLKTQNKLDSVYVYTSKAHHRLYERMFKKIGVKSKLTHDLDRDVVLEIDLEGL